MFCGFCDPSIERFDDDIAGIWPLMEGRSVEYWKNQSTGTWKNTIEVTGTDEIEIGGYRLATYVVTYTSVNWGNGWTGKAVYHYSPALGYVVRSEKTRSDKRDRKVWQLKSVVELNR
jgi:hypothetical protein